MDVELDTLPPDTDEDGDDEPTPSVHITVFDHKGVGHGASATLPDGTTDAEIAAALLRCARATAVMYGGTVAVELARITAG